MRQLTPEGRRIVEDVAQRHGFSVEAATVMLHALAIGGGGMAQFDHPEFGGMGQWSQGGMTMIGDMFNNALKARVDGLCAELSGLLAREMPLTSYPAGGQSQRQSQGGSRSGFSSGAEETSLFVPITGRASGGWWPAHLGRPSSAGQQNDIRYAVFPATRRLAIDIAGRLSVYDTLDHQIAGVSQQQSGDASLTFTSQHGLVRVADLPAVEPSVVSGEAPTPSPQPAETPVTSPRSSPSPSPSPAAAPPRPETAASTPAAGLAGVDPPRSATPAGESADDIFAKLERLAGLHDKGILSDEEFAAKKAELLARL